ncbi:hypothetical protein E2562_002384, partial [Oryza meyeriana var. granulata]
ATKTRPLAVAATGGGGSGAESSTTPGEKARSGSGWSTRAQSGRRASTEAIELTIDASDACGPWAEWARPTENPIAEAQPSPNPAEAGERRRAATRRACAATAGGGGSEERSDDHCGRPARPHKLSNGGWKDSVHEIESSDVALVLQNCVIDIPSTSKAAVDVFTKFMERDKASRNDNEEYSFLMDSIDNTHSLYHLILLAYKSNQQKIENWAPTDHVGGTTLPKSLARPSPAIDRSMSSQLY